MKIVMKLDIKKMVDFVMRLYSPKKRRKSENNNKLQLVSELDKLYQAAFKRGHDIALGRIPNRHLRNGKGILIIIKKNSPLEINNGRKEKQKRRNNS